MKQQPKNTRLPKPPKGYKTWMDYAVATADYRDAHHASIMQATPRNPSALPCLMRAAALAELDALRAAAGLDDSFPKRTRKCIEDDLKG
jgi:hypothetical protein